MRDSQESCLCGSMASRREFSLSPVICDKMKMITMCTWDIQRGNVLMHIEEHEERNQRFTREVISGFIRNYNNHGKGKFCWRQNMYWLEQDVLITQHDWMFRLHNRWFGVCFFFFFNRCSFRKSSSFVCSHGCSTMEAPCPTSIRLATPALNFRWDLVTVKIYSLDKTAKLDVMEKSNLMFSQLQHILNTKFTSMWFPALDTVWIK